MSSRALSLAAVMFLIGCLAAVQAQAENLDAGKSPSQLFAGTCSECHKSSRGLLRKVPAASLPGFLRQHYTTSGQMAAVLSAYLIANGAADRRPSGGEPKPGTDVGPGAADQADRRGRRLRPAEPAQAPAQATTERGPDGRSSVRPRRGKPGNEELPKTDAAKTDASGTSKTDAAKEESSKGDPVKDAKPPSEKPPSEKPPNEKPASEAATGDDNKPEGSKPEGTKPSGEGGSEAARIEPPKAAGGSPALPADPVPPVTPAPATPPAPPAASSAPPENASTSPASAAAPSEPPPASPPPAPPSATALAPPPAPSGPPAPPISQ